MPYSQPDFIRGGVEKCSAVVSDNIGTSRLEQTIGSWEDIAGDQTLFGLIRLIIKYIEEISTKMESLEAKIDTLDTKITETNAISTCYMLTYSFVCDPQITAKLTYVDETGTPRTVSSDSTSSGEVWAKRGSEIKYEFYAGTISSSESFDCIRFFDNSTNYNSYGNYGPDEGTVYSFAVNRTVRQGTTGTTSDKNIKVKASRYQWAYIDFFCDIEVS